MMASLLPFIAVPLIVQKDYHVFRQIIANLPALEADWYTAIEQKKIAWLGAAKQWRSMQIEPESFKRWFAGHGQELISSDLWRYAECLAIEEARPKIALLYHDLPEIERDEC